VVFKRQISGFNPYLYIGVKTPFLEHAYPRAKARGNSLL